MSKIQTEALLKKSVVQKNFSIRKSGFMSRNDDKETMTMLRADFSPGETLIIDGTRLTITWISGDKVGLKIESSEQIEAPDNTVVQSGNVVLFPRLK